MEISISRGLKNSAHGLMIKFILVAFLMSTAFIGRSQVKYSLGASMGYDKSFNQFYKMPKINQDKTPDYNFGIDGVITIFDWLRVKTNLHYANMGFTRYWEPDLTITTTGGDSRINKSKVAMSNFDLSTQANLRFLSLGKDKLELFAALGFNFEFQMGKYERTYTLAGNETDNDYVNPNGDEFNKSRAGAVGGLLFKYNVTPNWAITLNPQYTYFFKPYVFQNDYVDDVDWWIFTFNKHDMRRFTVNIGFEYRL
jgi:hypothetical protein